MLALQRPGKSYPVNKHVALRVFYALLVNTLCNIVHIREEVRGEEEGGSTLQPFPGDWRGTNWALMCYS